MAPRKNGNTYRGGSTIIGPGGRWPEAADPEPKAAPIFKRFSGDGNAEKLEAARVRTVDEARMLTLKARAARESLERRIAKLAAANVTTRAKAGKVAVVAQKGRTRKTRIAPHRAEQKELKGHSFPYD